MHYIRKSLAIVMILVMTSFIFTGCGASDAQDEFTGTWKCSALDMGTGDILNQLGSTYADSIFFYALDDGTCLLDMAGQQIAMEWTYMEENNDYKISMTVAGLAEANGMTEDELKEQMAVSSDEDFEAEHSYRAELKDGKLIAEMGLPYDDSQESEEGSSSESSYKMEFTFDLDGDAPASLDDVKLPVEATTDSDSSVE